MDGPKKALAAAPRPADRTVAVRPLLEAQRAFLSPNTRRGYVRDWMDFFAVDDISRVTLERARAVVPDDVAGFRDQLLARGLKPGSVARKLSSVRSFYNRLILLRLVDLNPAHPKLVQPPKRGDVRKMDSLTRAEALAFLRAIDRTIPSGRRDYALVMADLHFGLRRSEVLGIRTEQFKTADDRAYVLFRSKGQKERLVSINRDLERALADYFGDRGRGPGWLFPGRGGRPLSGDMFWRIVRRYLRAAGLSKRIGTHGLRATFITVNIEKGTPLSEIQRTVGHSRPETTLGYARDLEMIKSRAPMAMEGLNSDGPEANT